MTPPSTSSSRPARPSGSLTRRRPRAAAALVLALCAGLLLASCGGSSAKSAKAGAASASSATTTGAKPKLRKLTLMLDWTPNTNHSGIYIAKEQGWYAAAGLDVNIVEPGQDANSVQTLGAGKADIVVAASEDVLAGRSQGVPVVSLAAVIQHNTSSLVSLKKDGIATIKDLPGHTYGGYGGPLEEALVKKLASCGGGDPAKVKFVTVGDADYRAGMERGDYNFVWIFDGWDGIRYSKIDKLPVNTIPFIAHTDCIPDWYTPVIASSEKLIKDDPALLKKFMAATARGYQMAMAQPSVAVQALMKGAPELDRNLVTLSAAYLASRYASDPKAWGHQDLAIWTRFATFVHDAGMTTKAVQPQQAFTNAFLPGSG